MLKAVGIYYEKDKVKVDLYRLTYRPQQIL